MSSTRKPLLTRRRILLFALIVIILSGLACLALLPRDPLFHGKPESQWITNIVYGMSLSDEQNREQVQRWRDFGPDGLRVLERGLSAKRGRAYQNFHRRLRSILPSGLLRFLPTPPPKTAGGTRLLAMDLLCRMGKDAYPARPAVARALSDEDPWVRGRAITFFTGPEDDKAFLNQLPANDKKKLLPLFIHALESGGQSSSLRNNATIALRYYPEQASLVAPVLVKALQDPLPMIRIRAAEALNRVDPAAASKAGVVTLLALLLRDPDYQVSGKAAFALRQCQNDSDKAVSALIDALQGSNRAVVGASAVWALEHAFPQHTDKIVPELRKAAELNDNAGRYARSALKSLESKTGVK